jgi:hypothetical protein
MASRAWFSSHILLLLAVATAGLSLFLLAIADGFRPLGYGFWLASLIAGAGIVRGIITIVRRKRLGTLTNAFAFGTAVAVVFNVIMMGMGALLGLLSQMQFHRGRQLRRGARVLLPPVAPGGAYCQVPLGTLSLDCDRAALASQWRENGRTEHASVAAFAQHTLSLIALGAPPRLIADAQRDALDEIRHTELCFSLARAIDGVESGPGAFAEAREQTALPASRGLSLSSLAVHSLIDGALHEGVSARIVARLARSTESPVITRVLKEIAADEGRHAAHGWDVVEWCVAEGGTAVLRALEGALRTLPASMSSPLPSAARDGSWERFGIHGEALERSEYEKARAELVRRVTRLREARLLAA